MPDDGPKDLCECGHRRHNHRASGPNEGSCEVRSKEQRGVRSKKFDIERWKDGCWCAKFVLAEPDGAADVPG